MAWIALEVERFLEKEREKARKTRAVRQGEEEERDLIPDRLGLRYSDYQRSGKRWNFSMCCFDLLFLFLLLYLQCCYLKF